MVEFSRLRRRTVYLSCSGRPLSSVAAEERDEEEGCEATSIHDSV